MKKLLAIVIMLGGCGSGVFPDKNDRNKEIETRQKLVALYESLKGRYSGEVQTTDRKYPQKAEIALFPSEVKDGTDTDGNPKMRPVLKGRFRLLEYVGSFDDVVMDVTYYKETGEIVMSSSSGSALPGTKALEDGTPEKNSLSVKGTISGDVMNVRVTSDWGDMGILQATRTSKIVEFDDDAELDRRARLIEIISQLVGTYRGRLVPDHGDVREFELRLYRLETTGGYSTLQARLIDINLTPGLLDYVLAINYFPRPKILTMRNISSPGGTVPGAGTMSFTGEFSNQEPKLIQGELVDHRGPLGTITFRKVKN